MEWKLLKTVKGNVEIELPENFQEVKAVIQSGDLDIHWIFDLNKLMDSLGNKQYFSGRYNNSNAYDNVILRYGGGIVRIGGVYQNGSNITTSSSLTVYYR